MITSVGDILSGPEIRINLTKKNIYPILKEIRNCEQFTDNFNFYILLNNRDNNRYFGFIHIDRNNNKKHNDTYIIQGTLNTENDNRYYLLNRCIENTNGKVFLSGPQINVNMKSGFTTIFVHQH